MNKIRKIVLILIGVILIMIFMYCASNFNKGIKENKDMSKFPYEEGVFPSKEEREQANIGVVYLANAKEFTKVWKTNKPITKIVVNIEYIINNIFNPAIKSINDLEVYFKANKEEISGKLYIDDYYDFQKVIMKITDNKDFAIVGASILENSTENKEGRIYSKIEFQLENKKKSILNLKIDEDTSKIYIRE